MSRPTLVYTIGHSTHPLEEFIDGLRAHGVERLIDVRTLPGSKRYPHFNREPLARSLRNVRIGYRHMKGLGGLRRARKDSPNVGWRNASFRGYADYMQEPAFAQNLQKLIEFASQKTCALMCAEALPWRCHRSLIADALTVRGVEVRHILGSGPARPHELTPFAVVRGSEILYPASS